MDTEQPRARRTRRAHGFHIGATVTVGGADMLLTDACAALSISHRYVLQRTKRLQISFQASLDWYIGLQRARMGPKLPPRPKRRYTRPDAHTRRPHHYHVGLMVTADGEDVLLAAACETYGLRHKYVLHRAERLHVPYQESFDWFLAAKRDPALGRRGRKPGFKRAKQKDFVPIFYVRNQELMDQIALSKANGGRLTEKLGGMLILMSERYFRRCNYRGYTYVDEMRDAGLMVMLAAALKFDPEKSSNPFSYLTQCMKNAAILILRREKAKREMMGELHRDSDDRMEQEAPGSRSRHRRHGET